MILILDEANYGFLKHELQTTQSGKLDRLKRTHTAEEAARTFTGSAREGVGFERPGVEHYGPSVRAAQRAMGLKPQEQVADEFETKRRKTNTSS